MKKTILALVLCQSVSFGAISDSVVKSINSANSQEFIKQLSLTNPTKKELKKYLAIAEQKETFFKSKGAWWAGSFLFTMLGMEISASIPSQTIDQNLETILLTGGSIGIIVLIQAIYYGKKAEKMRPIIDVLKAELERMAGKESS